MLFFVKYFYQTFLLPPGIIIILLLLLSIWQYVKRSVKLTKAFIVTALLLYFVSVPVVGDSLIRSLESRYSPPQEVEGDVIIMLGGGAVADTPNINGVGHLSGFAANRLLTCAQLYHKLDAPIIISGGQLYNYQNTEAGIARNILLSLKIPGDKIILDDKSLNTTQNAKYTRELVDKYGFKKPILVTSAFHMERSLRQFQKAGLTVLPYSTDFQTNIKRQIHFRDFVPSADALLKFYMSLKEYIGLAASKWY